MRCANQIVCLVFATGLLAPAWAAEKHTSLPNANHIFNAIHASMRQWGSSVGHNGMSAFLATVPAGTQLYHGGPDPEAVTGMEWVAFEPEHSLQFARIRLIPGILPPLVAPDTSLAQQDATHLSHKVQLDDSAIGSSQVRPPPGKFWDLPGFLYTFVAKHDLRLLYLDGSAAAKCDRGTLDFSDYLMLNTRDGPDLPDDDRAEQLCQMSTDKWHGYIEGFVRMECGFEIIICSFNRSLTQVERQTPFDMFPSSKGNVQDIVFHWLRAASKRFDGIGGSPARVTLDYDNFVSVYATNMNLSLQSPGDLPRIDIDDTHTLTTLRQSITDMILQDRHRDMLEEYEPVNWQAITDLVVNGFADELLYLVNTSRFATSGIMLAREVMYILRADIDVLNHHNRRDIGKCIARFIAEPPQLSPGDSPGTALGHRAIYEVTNRICSTLHEVLKSLPAPDAADKDDIQPHDQILKLRELIDYLAWPVWKRCRGCQAGEICMIPMFPWGTMEDFQHPRCKSFAQIDGASDYWRLTQIRAR